jgi:hypothetical protein
MAMTLRHVVMFRWNDDVGESHRAAVRAALSTLPGRIPEIADYRHGPDAGINDGNFDYVVVADFASRDHYLVYRDHPDHQAVIAELITGHVAARAAVQYEIAD